MSGETELFERGWSDYCTIDGDYWTHPEISGLSIEQDSYTAQWTVFAGREPELRIIGFIGGTPAAVVAATFCRQIASLCDWAAPLTAEERPAVTAKIRALLAELVPAPPANRPSLMVLPSMEAAE